jgi:hypothetical protein
MRSVWLAVLAGAVAAGPVATAQTFRADVRAVAVYATVKDESGRLVTDLRQEDFRVFDEGRPVALELFDATPQPMDVVLLLDTSMSMRGSLTTLRDAAGALLARLGPQDRARMAAFSDVVMWQEGVWYAVRREGGELRFRRGEGFEDARGNSWELAGDRDLLDPALYPNALERIEGSKLERLLVTNTIPVEAAMARCPRIRALSVAPLLGEAIQRIHDGTSVSSLFV